MAPTRTPGHLGKQNYELTCSPETPGPLGHNDHGSPNAICMVGDTPGSVGRNDLAGSEWTCQAKRPESDPYPTPSRTDDVEVFVFDVDTLLEWARWPAGNAGAIGDLQTIVKLFRDFGLDAVAKDLERGAIHYYFKAYGGKHYIIFKGYPGLRETLTSTRYVVDNTKVLNMAIGKAGVAKSGLKGGVLTLVLVAALDVVEYLLNDEATLADLGVSLFSDLTKVAIASAIGTAVGVAVAGALTGAVIVPIAAAVAVGVVVSLGLDWIDEKLGLTKSLRSWANTEWERIQREYANAKYETERWWNFLNTAEGIMWLQYRLSGR